MALMSKPRNSNYLAPISSYDIKPSVGSPVLIFYFNIANKFSARLREEIINFRAILKNDDPELWRDYHVIFMVTEGETRVEVLNGLPKSNPDLEEILPDHKPFEGDVLNFDEQDFEDKWKSRFKDYD